MAKGQRITGTDSSDFLRGTGFNDWIFGRGGDDLIDSGDGNDRVRGEAGFDTIFGGSGRDLLVGGTENDNLYGGDHKDWLHGDSGVRTVKGTDFGSDRLDGGNGADVLNQSEGNDTMTLGAGRDTVAFKWQDPMIALAAGTGRAFTAITDFDPDEDTMVFDVAGLGRDAVGANFIDGGNGTVKGMAASFFSGAAGNSNGEAVMVLTETGFATGVDAVLAAENEAAGDFVLYFNTTVNVASLLYVDAPDTAHSIARFTGINSLDELGDAGFGAGDFLFA